MLQVDDDWKAQAQREKEKLAEREKASQAAAKPSPATAATKSARPETSSFAGLVQSLATQSLMMMGAIADPRTGRAAQDLDYARALLDSVVMLEEKTKGNLTVDEADIIAGTLYELRDTYVRAAWMSRSTVAQ